MATVLVVDDDLLYRNLMVEALRLENHQVYEAHGKTSALRTLSQQIHFDVVLCDLQMDGLDGLDLIKTLKVEYPQIGVVVVSAHSFEYGVGEAARSYAAECLSKPFSIVRLINTIKRISQHPVQHT